MWFKNLRVYRMPIHWQVTKEQIAEALLTHIFQPLQSLDMKSMGWVSPRDNGELVYSSNKQLLITLATEKKLLPSTVINEAARIKAAEVEDQQGFKPGRKQMKEIKQDITDELLPKAFSTKSYTRCWIDPINGWLVVDAGSPSRADDVIKMLIKSVEKLPLETLHIAQTPMSQMTSWLLADEAPAGFTVDQDATLRSNGEGKATVQFTRHTLEAEDITRHIAAGKQCTKLALTWADKISFVLHEDFAIKRISPLDVIKENADVQAQNDDERYEGDFVLMTGELNKLLSDLLLAFGGEVPRT